MSNSSNLQFVKLKVCLFSNLFKSIYSKYCFYSPILREFRVTYHKSLKLVWICKGVLKCTQSFPENWHFYVMLGIRSCACQGGWYFFGKFCAITKWMWMLLKTIDDKIPSFCFSKCHIWIECNQNWHLWSC